MSVVRLKGYYNEYKETVIEKYDEEEDDDLIKNIAICLLGRFAIFFCFSRFSRRCAVEFFVLSFFAYFED